MSNLLRCLFISTLAIISNTCLAYSSIATIDNHAVQAWYRANNYTSQKEADVAAIEGCRVEARKNGIGNIASKCKVVTRAKGPGYGSIVCGDNGCGWVTGYESSQDAVNGAYDQCSKSYKNCQEKDIQSWEDFAGFAAPKTATAPTSADCRPRTQALRCTSSCTNGNCVVSYENGCKMRVQISPRFDGLQNQWVYPAPSC